MTDTERNLLTVIFRIKEEARLSFKTISEAMGIKELDCCKCDEWDTMAMKAIVDVIGLSDDQDIYDDLTEKICRIVSDGDTEELLMLINRYVKVTGIEYDKGEGDYLPEDLPDTVAVPIEEATDADSIADYIEDDLGYIIKSFRCDKIDKASR